MNNNKESKMSSNNVNLIKSGKVSDGIVFSSFSCLIFCCMYLPYILKCISFLYIPGDSAVEGYFILFGGWLIALPIFINYIFTIIAVLKYRKYKKYGGEIKIFRKIIHIINIISLILMLPFVGMIIYFCILLIL